MGKSSSTYKRASSLLMERFPTLGLLSGTWEEKPALNEQLSPFQIGRAEVLYVYGLGSGGAYFQYREWLKAKPERRLVFLEEEGGIIASFLHQRQALDVLSDPQVHLELNPSPESLAERFPVQRIEIAALPSYAHRRFRHFRLKLLRKTALSHAVHLDRLHGYQPFKNFIENAKQIAHSFYANALKGSFQNVPAIVCGAGPSLQASFKLLKTLENKALIIAGGSTIAALSAQGILPHFGMAVDPNLEEYRRFKNSFAFEVPLLYSTRLHPGVFQTMNGPFGYMRSGIGGLLELWLEEELGLLDPLLGDFLSPESASVTPICIAWAQFLGCNPILLNGIDMAYTGNKRYAPGVAEEEETAFQAIDAEKSAADRILKRKDRLGNPVFTAVRWVMESASISHFAKKHPETHFVNTTEGGIGFKAIPYQPLEEAIRGFAPQELRKRVHEKIEMAQMVPGAEEIIEKNLKELHQSLLRLIDHLKILAQEKKGSAALAEMELQEEIAALYLFYDIRQILKPGACFWERWLDLAIKYEKMFPLHTHEVYCAKSGR